MDAVLGSNNFWNSCPFGGLSRAVSTDFFVRFNTTTVSLSGDYDSQGRGITNLSCRSRSIAMSSILLEFAQGPHSTS